MGLTESEITTLRNELESAVRPIYFFHDDSDGLASFLLFYKVVREGKGVIIKSNPVIDERHIKLVEEYKPDKIFVLDIATVEQEFIDGVSQPIFWVDHHGPYERKGIHYFNPRTRGRSVPASYLCYQVTQQDMWIAMAGIVGDWHLIMQEDFSQEYPDLLSLEVKTPPEALFTSEVGKLSRIFNFALKGTAKDAMKYVKTLSRIESPYDILEQRTPEGAYIYKKFMKYEREYQMLLEDALSQVGESRIILYEYPASKTSFTGELANELLYKYPEKIIIIAREHNGEMKCSLRSGEKTIINTILTKTLEEVGGLGGGHEHACGCVIQNENFKTFLSVFESHL
ncbi:MAG: DHHA1 domain-containing protein [Nanobdellota archaeon]